MKKSVCWILILCMTVVLAGCSSSLPTQNTISVDKKGTVTVTIVEDFDKDYYDADELSEEIDEDIAEYNINFASDRVSLEEFKVENGVAVLQLSFEAGRYYADYMDVTFFVGTVLDALDEGYDLSGDFIDPDGNVIGIEDIDGYSGADVLILEEAAEVEVPSEVKAAGPGENVVISGKKTVTVAGDSLSYIIY